MNASPDYSESYIWGLLQLPSWGSDGDSEQFDLFECVTGLPETAPIPWEDGRRLWTPEQVADYLGISVSTVHELCRLRKLGFVRVTERGDRRFTDEHLEEFIRAQSVKMRKPVDDKGSTKVRSPRKGGEKKSVELSRTDLLKEFRSW